MKKNSIYKKMTAFIGDSLQNVLTGMGIEGLDKSASSKFVEVRLDYQELEAAYGSDWLSGKVIDLPPYDMTREWRTMTGDMTPEKKEAFIEAEEILCIQRKFKEAMQWARLYGGAGIIFNVEDNVNPWEPLLLENIKKGSLKSIVVIDRQFLHLGKVDSNPLSDNYGYPETYRISQTSLEIHHTRIIRFEGIALPLQSRRQNQYWGKSILERIHTALVRAAEVQENIGSMLHEATVDIIKIPELMSLISSPDTEKELQKRFGVAKLQKSVNRMLLMDAEEEYEQHQQTFSGLSDILEKMLNVVGGAADIPITRLFGQSPGGMNSTGESDLRNYYDNLSSQQNTDLSPKLKRVDSIVYASLFGKPHKKDEISFKWNQLWQMTEAEQAELENAKAERDIKYMDANIINETMVATGLMESGTYSTIDAAYLKELEKTINEMEEEQEEQFNSNGNDDKEDNGEPKEEDFNEDDKEEDK